MASVTTTSKNMPKLVMAKLLRMRSKLTRWILIHGLGALVDRYLGGSGI